MCIRDRANIKERFKIIGENADGINLPDACNTAPQIASTDIIGKYSIVILAKSFAVLNVSRLLIKPGAKPIIK